MVREGEGGDALVDQEAILEPPAGPDCDDPGLECLLGGGDSGYPQTHQQLDTVVARISEELEELQEASESSESPDGDERILDIRVRDWGASGRWRPNKNSDFGSRLTWR